MRKRKIIYDKNIQAVFFDYGGTLDADGVAWKERFYPLYLKNGINISFEDFTSAYYPADDSMVGGDTLLFSLKETIYEQVRRVLMHLEIYNKEMNEKIAEEFYQNSCDKIEENKKILTVLKKKYRLGIISNNYGNLKHICNETGLTPLMDVITDSTLVGFTKPDKRIFSYALNALNVKPVNTIMIGDSLWRDMKGAKAIGMKHIFLVSQKNHNTISSCCPDDPVINKMSELLELLGLS
jgi:HAD superfamily hydrolase (TIGR01549 family)